MGPRIGPRHETDRDLKRVGSVTISSIIPGPVVGPLFGVSERAGSLRDLVLKPDNILNYSVFLFLQNFPNCLQLPTKNVIVIRAPITCTTTPCHITSPPRSHEWFAFFRIHSNGSSLSSLGILLLIYRN